jgi:RNA polymerase sigma-70 factor (ECF subfamily)
VEEFLGLAGGDDTADRALELVATDRAIAMIAALPRDQAEVILLRLLGGLSTEEIGSVMSKRAGTIRVLQHRAVDRLVREFGPVVTSETREAM